MDFSLVFKIIKLIETHVNSSTHAIATDSTRTAKLQFIQSLTDDLTITNQNFLVQFCSYFNNINNTDEIVNQISFLLELFDVEKTIKRLDYLNNEEDDDIEMGRFSSFLNELLIFLINISFLN